MRDEALDRHLALHPPQTAERWMRAGAIRQLQGRSAQAEVDAAEALGWVWPLFGETLDADTPGLQELAERRSAWAESHRGTVAVEIPEVFELANIALSQTTYGQEQPGAMTRDSDYWQAVQERFGPHRDHPLITDLNAIPVGVGTYYSFRNVSAAYIFDDDALALSGIYSPSEIWGGSRVFTERLELIEDFARVTDARGFLAENRPMYDGIIQHYEETIQVRAMWAWLDERFPGEQDGVDALVVRASPLIGGAHNASSTGFDGFTEGVMVTIIGDGAPIAPERVGAHARMVFTEIDHHYVNPVSDRHAEAIDAAIPDIGRFNGQEGRDYRSAYLTFNEYATWVLFDVWWAEHCEQVSCPEEVREAGARNTGEVMQRRSFLRYSAFRDAMVPVLQGAATVEDVYPLMIDWFVHDAAAR